MGPWLLGDTERVQRWWKGKPTHPGNAGPPRWDGVYGWKLTEASRVHPCNPIDCRPPGSFVHGILQLRILEWVATPISRGSSPPRD